MKKLYTFLVAILVTSLSFGQGPIITGIGDGDCSGGNPKMLEIYANGTVDFTQYSLEKQTNGNNTWNGTFDLSPLGTVTDTFVYLYKDAGDGVFAAEFPSATNTLDVGSAVSVNGDDRLRIIETATSTVIDQYGVEATDGSGTDWEYKDGYAKRNNNTPSNGGAFVSTNWTNGNSLFDGQGLCQGGASFESIMTIGTYTPPTTATPMLAITSPTAATVLNPEASNSMDLTFVVQNFAVDVPSGTGDGHVHYKVDNGATVMIYTTNPITLTGLASGSHTVDMWLVDNSHNPLSPPVEASVTFTIATYTQVANLAELRASNLDAYYEVIGEVVPTYGQSYRNQAWLQDATAGIKIDDNDGIVTTDYAPGDGISGIKGFLKEHNGVSQLVPTVDPGTPSSTGNVITPEIVTLSDLLANIDNYESELVQIKNATMTDYDDGGSGTADGTFQTGKNYPLTDASGVSVLRTNFYNADYIGTAFPTVATDFICIVGEYNGDLQVTPRDAVDMTAVGLDQPAIEGFSLYPNPTNAILNVITKQNLEKNIQIVDLLGKQVFNTTTFKTTINVSNLTNGIYIIKVTEAGHVATHKLVIK